MIDVRRKSIGIIALAFVALAFGSCKKYDEGGLISKADKRLTAHTWKLSEYHRNGNNETSLLLISNFTEQFTSDGAIVRSYTDKNGDPFSETGSWSLTSDNMRMDINGVSSIELTDETSTVSSSEYNILRLKKDELWYYYENGGDRHEFRLIPNE